MNEKDFKTIKRQIYYKIDKNIPFPRAEFKLSPYSYPFEKMKISDSFLVTDRGTASINTAVYNYRKKHPDYNFIVSKVEGGMRVWRVE